MSGFCPLLRLVDACIGIGVGSADFALPLVTRARLEELYGGAQCLTIEASSPAGGTRVIIELPFRPASARPTAAPVEA